MYFYPHIGEVAAHEGSFLNQARAGLIVLHSRTGRAKGIMRLAPQSEGNSWYPEQVVLFGFSQGHVLC
jgi:hypothetical protein